MEMHQLRYVVAVARAGTFSRAAEHCHVAQPSLSQQIRKLEEELGERLFDRMKRDAKLTPHGEAFLRRAVRILEEAEAAKREALEATRLLRGTLSIGVLPTIAPYLLQDVLVAFSEAFPGIETVVHEETTAQLLKELFACELDLALASLPLPEERIEVRTLFHEELMLALPPAHPLARKRKVSIDDLRHERLIVMKPGHCLGDQVLSFCDRRDIQPRISFRGAQLETIRALVRAGAGISLIPAMATRPPRADAPAYRSLAAPKPMRAVVAAWAKQRPPGRAATEFLSIVSSWCKQRGN
jgi:LysR family hydrogen peroxide-inducible transcriptional activator